MEVVLHTLTENTLKKELKIAVLFELIQDLLLKVFKLPRQPHCTLSLLSYRLPIVNHPN